MLVMPSGLMVFMSELARWRAWKSPMVRICCGVAIAKLFARWGVGRAIMLFPFMPGPPKGLANGLFIPLLMPLFIPLAMLGRPWLIPMFGTSPWEPTFKFCVWWRLSCGLRF